ncbi:MAG: hypothetical protein IT210_00290 [Armatimonadetes bacterium]|nr:hypothetical protein [Armatimonadota bacterium]
MNRISLMPHGAIRCLVIALGLVSPAFGQGSGKTLPTRMQGPFIFLSLQTFDPSLRCPDDIAYAARFRVALSNWYLRFTGRDMEAFRRAGCELFIYLWFNGYYSRELDLGDPESAALRQFPTMIAAFRDIHRHPGWLLNPDRPIQGTGAEYPAYFYDYAHPAFRAHYIGFIRDRLRETGYQGVFFDYIGSWALPEEVKTLWQKRHPDIAYDRAGVLFLKELKRALPGVKVFGNQSYRLAEDYYGCVDYDLTESHATSYLWGKEAEIYVHGKGMQKVMETFYRPWDGLYGYKEMSRQRREKNALRPKVTVFDLNYLQPRYISNGAKADIGGKAAPVYVPVTDRPAIFYGYVLAKLTGVESFGSDWYAPGFGKDDLYFLNLGQPVSPSYEEKGAVVLRYFRNGFVAATRQGGRVSFTPDAKRIPPAASGLWDAYTKAPATGWKPGRPLAITPAGYPATGSQHPSGRVYLYLRGQKNKHR